MFQAVPSQITSLTNVYSTVHFDDVIMKMKKKFWIEMVIPNITNLLWYHFRPSLEKKNMFIRFTETYILPNLWKFMDLAGIAKYHIIHKLHLLLG